MSLLVFGVEALSAVFATLFVAYYLRILAKAHEAGPEPTSWIVAAVGFSLIASYAVIEVLLFLYPARIVFGIQRVYFLLGNVVIFGVLYRIWRNIGGSSGW
ncbi:MAG: hypothetical protein SVS85_01735 [Candidatus Nanohaloarchaea archaeon]|nr:hypothetical protein [Candidatus Nanohaloarchaea archaeon]